MDTNHKRPSHQPETEFTGERCDFEAAAVSPDDPSLEPRIRRGRPADRKTDQRFDDPAERDAQ